MTYHRDRFRRTELLLGKKVMEILADCSITVVGIGAVGSHVVEALARSGVGRLRLVDFDEIDLSNVNRQLFAGESTLGMLKIDAAERHLLDINPDITIEKFNCLCHIENFEAVLAGQTDLVVDAIDSLNPKVNLLYELVRRKMDVVSSMGAARRVTPGEITTGDISETRGCPLAKSVRKRLRRMGIEAGITCVYSTEAVDKSSVLDTTEENYFDSGRQRNPMGSLAMISGIFGYTAAAEALKKVLRGKGSDLCQKN